MIGKRARASGARSDYYDDEEWEDVKARQERWRAKSPSRTAPLAARLRRWRAQHAPRTYARGAILQRTQAWHFKADPSLAFGCAFGAPTSTLEVDAEFLCVPKDRGLGEGEERTPPIGASDDLFVYRLSASGERCEHTTSVARWLELAKTHPLVHAVYAYPRRLGRVLDSGEFGLSLRLSESGGGKEFAMGMNTQDFAPPSFVTLWWHPVGTGWSSSQTDAARSVFLDLCEVEAVDSLFVGDGGLEEAEGAAAASAASGAPEGPEKKRLRARAPSTDVIFVSSDSSPPSSEAEGAAEAQAKDETPGSDTEREDSRGAASGASDLPGLQADEQARARDAHRQQVHFFDAAHFFVELWRIPKKDRKDGRPRILHVVEVLRRVGWPVPNSLAFRHGISHQEQNVHFHFLVLGLLRKKIEGEGFDSERVFREAFPSLEPASGGAPLVVASVDRRHPIWQTLRGTWGVKNLPEFLKHICDKHGGEEEVRLLSRTWAPLPRRDVDVRNPAFWSPEFVREEESQRRFEDRDAAQWLTWADVIWVLSQNADKTLLICKYMASPRAHVFSIRMGTAPTLAQMHLYGEEGRPRRRGNRRQPQGSVARMISGISGSQGDGDANSIAAQPGAAATAPRPPPPLVARDRASTSTSGGSIWELMRVRCRIRYVSRAVAWCLLAQWQIIRRTTRAGQDPEIFCHHISAFLIGPRDPRTSSDSDLESHIANLIRVARASSPQ